MIMELPCWTMLEGPGLMIPLELILVSIVT